MKVTQEQILSKIVSETYIVMPNGRTTICQLTLENGFTVEGYSACVDAAEFDMNKGRIYAFTDAMNKVWPLEGYLLAQQLFEDAKAAKAHAKAQEKAESEKEWVVSITEGNIVAEQKPKKVGRPRKPRVAAKKTGVAKSAPYGYKKDGTPKKRPGRPSK
jgi:hypothetical protein